MAAIELKAAVEQASGKLLPILTATTVTWRLKAIADAPVQIEKDVFALRYVANKSGNGAMFTVVAVQP